jgi:hypothetical protein
MTGVTNNKRKNHIKYLISFSFKEKRKKLMAIVEPSLTIRGNYTQWLGMVLPLCYLLINLYRHIPTIIFEKNKK